MRKSLVLIFYLIVSTSMIAQFSNYKSNPYSNTILISLNGGVSHSETDYSNPEFGVQASGMAEYFWTTNSDLFFGIKLQTTIATLKGNNESENKFETNLISFGPSILANYKLADNIFPFINLGAENLWYDDFSSMSLSCEIGIRSLISDYFAIFGMVGLHFAQEDDLDLRKIEGSNNDFYSTFSVGLSYAVDLTVSTDLDGDGVEDSMDNCPEQSEDFDGFEDGDGCPEYDNDFDGIIDINDNCPEEQEDFDGFEDQDGCPDNDNDGDGIIDSEDNCPDLVEDFDGFEDNDGCPELDNDGDGIVDANDECPNVSENFNRFEDFDGCPDELPETRIEKEPEIIVPAPKSQPTKEKKIRVAISNEFVLEGDRVFASKSAKIKSSFSSELNTIAEQMLSNPGFKWRIEGHLDNSGNKYELKALSTAWANSIMKYFVSKGLSPKSFQVVGLADSFPLAPNSTIHGKLKNRRVVIKRIR